MKKRNKDSDKLVKKNLSKLFYRIISYFGLCLPKPEEKNIYTIPKQIKKFYDHIGNNSEINLIYETSGSLFGYSSVNIEENIINIVCFEVNKEFKDKAIFIIQNLSTVIKIEGYDSTVSFRCFFLPNNCFYDGEIKPEILNKYKENTCDASFYSTIDPNVFSFMYKGKLIKSYDRQLLYKYIDIANDFYNVVLNLSKYKQCLTDKNIIDSIHLMFNNIFSSKSFLYDHKPIDPNNPKLEYSTKISTKSYIGYDKIYILIPNVDEQIKKEFISESFKNLITSDNKIAVFNRLVFYEELPIDTDKKNDDLSSLHYINTEKEDDSIYYKPISFGEFRSRFLND